MRIGLDFDGVFVDISEIKSSLARELYGIDVPADKFSKSYVIGNGYLVVEQYAELQELIYNSREIGLKMQPVPGVLEFLPRLIAQRHVIKVVTSRKPAGVAIAREWSEAHDLHIEIVGVGQGVSKAEAVSGLEVFVDDDLNKLRNLVGVVANRFLFGWPYNARVETGYVARRISSWGELYYAVLALEGGR